MATEASDDEPSQETDKEVDEPTIVVNGTNDLICAPCFMNGDNHGAVGICKECKYYLCSKCVQQHRTSEQYAFHRIAFFYCARKLKVNRLVRANSFCLDCGHYLCQKCKLDHGGFREYRHHTFIGGKVKLHEPHDHSLLPKRKTLQSRGSRKSTSRHSIFTQREFGNKSPYVSNNNIVAPEPKRRTVELEERIVERPRKLLYSNVGRANNNESLLKADGSEIDEHEEKHVRCEEDHRARPAELVGEFSLKAPEDKRSCKIISSVFVGNDQLVVSDQGNKNIKLYNTEFQCQSTMKIEKFPVALCKAKDKEKELFASSGNRVLLLSALKALTLIREMKTDAPRIEGLATWDTGVAIVFKSNRSKHDKKGHLAIHLLNYDGETQYEVAISSQHVVQLDTPIWYIAMTEDDRHLLLSDTHNNRIICIDTTSWHVVYVLRGRTSGGSPKSLSLDQDGNLLVTWYGEVRKISPHGQDLGVYVANVAERATISYNERTKQIAVPSWNQLKQNQFRVYQLRV